MKEAFFPGSRSRRGACSRAWKQAWNFWKTKVLDSIVPEVKAYGSLHGQIKEEEKKFEEFEEIQVSGINLVSPPFLFFLFYPKLWMLWGTYRYWDC